MSNLNKRINAFDDMSGYTEYMASEVKQYPNIAYIRSDGSIEKVAGATITPFQIHVQALSGNASKCIRYSTEANPPSMFGEDWETMQKNYQDMAMAEYGITINDTSITKLDFGEQEAMGNVPMITNISVQGGVNLKNVEFMFGLGNLMTNDEYPEPMVIVEFTDFTPTNCSSLGSLVSQAIITNTVNIDCSGADSLEGMFSQVYFQNDRLTINLSNIKPNASINNLFYGCDTYNSGTYGLNLQYIDLSERTNNSEVSLWNGTDDTKLVECRFSENFFKGAPTSYNFKKLSVWNPNSGGWDFVEHLPQLASGVSKTIRMSSSAFNRINSDKQAAALAKGFTITTT